MADVFNNLKKNIEDVKKQIHDLKSTAIKKTKELVMTPIGILEDKMKFLRVSIKQTGEDAEKNQEKMNKAIEKFISETGEASNHTKLYQKVMQKIKDDNYGDSFEKVAYSMITVNNAMDKLNGSKLKKITESAEALEDTLGIKVSNSAKTAGKMVEVFGMSGMKAMELIGESAQKSKGKTEYLLDAVNKHSESFSKLGFKAKDMFEIFQKGASSGTYSTKQISNVFSEFSNNVTSGSKSALYGFDLIGLNGKKMAKQFKKENGDSKEAFEKTIAALLKMDDPIKQNIAGANLFGDQWKNTGTKVLTQLSEIHSKGEKNVSIFQKLGNGLKAVGKFALDVGGKLLDKGIEAAKKGVVAAKDKAINGSMDMSKAMGDFIASTGKGTEEAERYKKVLGNIYAGNYGDSFESIAEAMKQVTKSMGDLNDADLQNITQGAIALSDTFGMDISDSTSAAKVLMDQFGISGEQAMSMIAAGAQNGLDVSGDLLDGISTYSDQFAKVGLNADDMFNIFQKGIDSGTYSIESIGGAISEFASRATDGSATTAEGFSKLGLNADEMSAKFAAGGDTAKDAFQQTVDALANIQDPMEQNIAGADLFGEKWGELGPAVMDQLSGIEDGAYDTTDALKGIKDVKYDSVGDMFDQFQKSVEVSLIPLGDAVMPVIQMVLDSLMQMINDALPPLTVLIEGLVTQMIPVIQSILPMIIDLVNQILPLLIDLIQQVFPIILELIMELLPPLIQIISMVLPPLIELISALLPIFMDIINALLPIIDLFIALLGPIMNLISQAIVPLIEILSSLTNLLSGALAGAINFLVSVFSSQFSEVFNFISKIIQDCIGIFNGFIDFISNIFSGKWEDAWNSIVNILWSIVKGIGDILKEPINFMISILNGFIDGVNQIRLPDWVPGIGGKGINIPKIPRLKVGMDYVPNDYFPAFLDKGETVLTAEQASAYRKLGGINGLEAMLGGASAMSAYAYSSGLSNAPVNVSVDGNIHTHVDLDSREIGVAVSPIVSQELAAYSRRSR